MKDFRMIVCENQIDLTGIDFQSLAETVAFHFELTFNNSKLDFTDEMTIQSVKFHFAKMICKAVLRYVIDPERKKDPEKFNNVSDNGYNQTLTAIYKSLANLNNSVYSLDYDCFNRNMESLSFDSQDFILECLTVMTEKTKVFFDRFGYVNFFESYETEKLKRKTILVYDDKYYHNKKKKQRKTITAKQVIDSLENGNIDLLKETTETTVIQEIYKALRRYISDYHNGNDSKHVYISLDECREKELSAKDESLINDIYIRLPYKRDLLSVSYDFNGNETFENGSGAEYMEYYSMIEKLNLTDREFQFLDLRMQGLTSGEIAKKLSVNRKTILSFFARLQGKAKTAFNLPENFTVEKETFIQGREKLTEKQRNDIYSAFIFGKSQAQIAKEYSVSKMTVCKIVKAFKEKETEKNAKKPKKAKKAETKVESFKYSLSETGKKTAKKKA